MVALFYALRVGAPDELYWQYQIPRGMTAGVIVGLGVFAVVLAWRHGDSLLRLAFPPPERKYQRIGFVILILAIAMTSVGVVAHIQNMRIERLFSDLWELIYAERIYGWRDQWEYWFARTGALLTIAGYVLAYHYDSTLGRVVRWINAGR